jgi:hypothetical protein
MQGGGGASKFTYEWLLAQLAPEFEWLMMRQPSEFKIRISSVILHRVLERANRHVVGRGDHSQRRGSVGGGFKQTGTRCAERFSFSLTMQ